MRPRGHPTPPRRIWRRSERTSRTSIRGKSHTLLAYLWQHMWTRPRLIMRSHWNWGWRQWYTANVYTGRADTPTSARNTSNSDRGRRTAGISRRPPAEGALAMSGRHFTAHVMHGGYPTGSGLDYPSTNYKRDYQHTGHRTARDPAEGGGGADRHPSMHKPPVA